MIEGRPAEQDPARVAALLRAIGEATSDLIYAKDRQSRFIYCNAATAALIGRPGDAIMGRDNIELFPDSAEARTVMASDDLIMQSGTAKVLEEAFTGPDGVTRYFRSAKSPMRDADGAIIGLAGVSTDITERRRREAALSEKEQRLRLALMATNDAIWDWNLVANEVRWNEALEEIHGHAPSDVEPSGDWWLAQIHPDDRARIDASIHAVIEGTGEAWRDEYRFRRGDGSYAEIIDRGRVLRDESGRAIRMIGAMLDVSSLRHVEERLRESEGRMRLAAEAARIGTWDYDPVTQVLRWDVQCKALFGLPPDAEVSYEREFLQGLHPLDRERVDAAVRAALSPGGSGGYDIEYRTIGANDGVERWLWANGRAVFEGGRAMRLIGTIHDITDQKRIEERLRESEAKFEAIANSIDQMIWSTLPDGFHDYYNQRWYDFTGVPVGTTDGDSWNDVFHPDDRERAWGAWRKCLETGQPYHIEYRLRHHSGTYRWVIGRALPVRDESGAIVRWYGTCTDVDDLKRAEAALRELNETLEGRVAEEVAERAKAEEALRQAQKMEAVGQLTGGIAHDFNNLLTVVIGNIDMARRAAGKPDRLARTLDNAQRGAERAAALTQRLLAFSRRQPLDPKAVSLNLLLQSMGDLIDRAVGETIRFELAALADPWLAEADPNQLESAILNLVVNARDAMPEGGILTIATNKLRVDTPRPAIEGVLAPGDYVVVSVADTGQGIAPELLQRVFEPFFTTKEVGKGTGLGLSQVYGFARQSGGSVEIESTPGGGTAVRLLLPRVHASEEVEADADVTLPVATGSGETILVVEDDDAVRAFTIDALRDAGYRVLEAADGFLALRLIEALKERIDLLLTDVVMPGMSGRELADRVLTSRPGVAVLYTSGYTRDAIAGDRRIEPGLEMLGKPFTSDMLARRVREMLDRG